jgi:16S rRNA (guanine527-N7)-methyltransferase
MHIENRKPEFLKLGFNEKAWPALKAYLELLWSANQELNLVSRKMSFEDLIDNHVLDCLLPLPFFAGPLKTVADFGSGSGLPAVLYALQFPQTQFHLFEKSVLKQNFLLKCQKIAPNLVVAGEIKSDLKNIELVTARAFKPLDVILEMSRSYFQAGGSYFLLKGRREKIDQELLDAQKKFPELRRREIRIEILKSPVLEVERHLVIIPRAEHRLPFA